MTSVRQDGLSPQISADDTASKTGVERRKFPRRPLDAIVAVQPIDERGEVCGNLTIGQCRNVSEGGIAFMCRRPITARFLRLNLLTSGHGLEAATIEVLRDSPIGTEFEIAGKYVTLPADLSSEG